MDLSLFPEQSTFPFVCVSGVLYVLKDLLPKSSPVEVPPIPSQILSSVGTPFLTGKRIFFPSFLNLHH